MASIFPLFVPAIRDYIDVLNNAYDSVASNNNLQEIVQQTIIYLFASIKFLFIYFLSFQWLQDLTYLPVVIPQIKLEILKEQFFLHTPQSIFFTFLEIPSYTNNKFFLGFANSFFLCLPLSVAQIISIRRLLIQGLSAGIFSALGTLCGQVLLLTCILFGGRLFITPWFNFQVFNYCIGILVVLKIVYDMAHERSIRIIESSNTFALVRIFLLNFILAWTEQSCIFQYFGNLTVGAEPSIIEIFSSLSALQSILAHITYIIGIFIGSILFTSLFIFTTLKLSNLCVQLLSILYSRWIRKLNFALIALIISFTFTSIPFYSFDYLVLSNLGFVAQDKGLKNTVFSDTKIEDFTPPTLGDPHNTYIDQRIGLDTDIARFNKGRYLMFDINDSFEQLNYQGEYAWLTKKHRTPKVGRDLSSLAILSKAKRFFKKNKKFSPRQSLSRQKKLGDNQENRPKNSVNDINLKKDSAQEQNTLLNSSTITNNDFFEFDENMEANKLFDFRHKIENRINNSFEELINKSTSNKFFVQQEDKFYTQILQNRFQQKYYSNPIYKLLLSSDIDLFLLRQPRSFVLSRDEEHTLFEKRIILANYYDSLRYYNQLPYVEEFQDFFNGSKTYADRVYNQQFNGTLKIVRRLFSINVSKTADTAGEENLSNNQKNFSNKNRNSGDAFILKFDQPLYKKIHLNNFSFNSFFHEELNGPRNLAEKANFNSNTFKENVHDDNSYQEKNAGLQNNQISHLKPFIELTNPIPFYVGWDEQLRKLVITNRLSPISLAGESMKFSNKNYENNYYTLNRLIQKNKTISFTTWPLTKSNLNNIKQSTSSSLGLQLKNPINNLQKPKRLASSTDSVSNKYNFLSESIIDPQNNQKLQTLIDNDENLQKLLAGDALTLEEYGKLESVPSNIIVNGGLEAGQLQDIIPYTRGGFVWPGHADLKIKFKNVVSR